MEKKEGGARLAAARDRGRGRARVRAPRRCHRWRVRCEHDERGRHADDRWAGSDRRRRSRARGMARPVQRGAAGRPARRDRQPGYEQRCDRRRTRSARSSTSTARWSKASRRSSTSTRSMNGRRTGTRARKPSNSSGSRSKSGGRRPTCGSSGSIRRTAIGSRTRTTGRTSPANRSSPSTGSSRRTGARCGCAMRPSSSPTEASGRSGADSCTTSPPRRRPRRSFVGASRCSGARSSNGENSRCAWRARRRRNAAGSPPTSTTTRSR